jgi:hypothetical protein
MSAINEPGQKGLPPAIPAEELEKMLGTSQGFCASDAPNTKKSELAACWPFLFSPPLMGTYKKPTK